MKKYHVTMTRDFFVRAKNKDEAEKKAIEICANNSEELMPHNMMIDVSLSKLPTSYFD